MLYSKAKRLSEAAKTWHSASIRQTAPSTSQQDSATGVRLGALVLGLSLLRLQKSGVAMGAGHQFDGCTSPVCSAGLRGERWHRVLPPARLRRSPCQSCGEASVSHVVTNFPTSEVRGASTACMKQDADESKFKMSLMNNSLNVCK